MVMMFQHHQLMLLPETIRYDAKKIYQDFLIILADARSFKMHAMNAKSSISLPVVVLLLSADCASKQKRLIILILNACQA